MTSLRRLPVVLILGATGTGKSKLAIELAEKFNGEIVSADSMQLYTNLDIITNKVNSIERKRVVHHLIDAISPLIENFTVVDYKKKALPLIQSMLSQGKMPVIVGGTNYYIEALVWKFLLDDDKVPLPLTICQSEDEKDLPSSEQEADGNDHPSGEQETHMKTTDISASVSRDECLSGNTTAAELWTDVETGELYRKLMKVDEPSRHVIHPNDRRKIIRALQVYEQYGKPMSELLADQHSLDGARGVSGPLLYPHTCAIWLQCDKNVLDARTDARVDEMISAGLIEEMTQFHEEYNKHRLEEHKKPDYTRGIFQSIGFKEFHKFLLLNHEERNSNEGKKLLSTAVDDMKRATRQYARRQTRWIINRFVRRSGPNTPPLLAVDATHLDQWQSTVLQPSIDAIKTYLEGEMFPTSSLTEQTLTDNCHVYNVCEACEGRVFVNTYAWQAHITSRKHRENVARHRRRLSNPELNAALKRVSATLDQFIVQNQQSSSS